MHRLVLHRRGIVQLGLAGLASAALPKPASGNLATPRGRARSCILLYMDGGPSHIDLLDLKPHAPADVRGPYRPFPTSVPGIQIGELMPLTARQMHRLLLVRSMRHEETVHDPAVYQMLTGYKHVSSAGDLRVEETDLPHIACAASQADRQPAALPRALHLPEKMKMNGRILPGQNHGILASSYDSLQIDVSHAARLLGAMAGGSEAAGREADAGGRCRRLGEAGAARAAAVELQGLQLQRLARG